MLRAFKRSLGKTATEGLMVSITILVMTIDSATDQWNTIWGHIQYFPAERALARQSRAACSSTTRPSFDFVQLPNHLDASPWIISHISGSTCIRLPVGHAQELGVGVCLLLLKHRRINTPNFSREITGLLRSLVIAVLSVISFCLGGKHLFIA